MFTDGLTVLVVGTQRCCFQGVSWSRKDEVSSDMLRRGVGWQGCCLQGAVSCTSSVSWHGYFPFSKTVKHDHKYKTIYWHTHDTTLLAESEEELKSLLIKVKEEHEKSGLKLSIQRTKRMAFSSITSQQIDGETMETVTDFIFLGSKIIGDGDYSHEIKKHSLLGKKNYNKPR